MKTLFFDVETTGLDPVRNDIIQFAWILDIDGKVVAEGEALLPPLDLSAIDPAAIEVSGTDLSPWQDTTDEARREKALSLKHAWEQVWGLYCNKYDPADKMTPAGYNGGFDYSFLSSFYKKMGDKFFGSWFNHRIVDPLAVFRFEIFCGRENLKQLKLKTMAELYGIELQAHNARSDIRATRELVYILKNKHKGVV